MEAKSNLASTSFYGRYSTGVDVKNVVTKLELSVGLLKVKSTLGAYVWEVKENCLI